MKILRHCTDRNEWEEDVHLFIVRKQNDSVATKKVIHIANITKVIMLKIPSYGPKPVSPRLLTCVKYIS